MIPFLKLLQEVVEPETEEEIKKRSATEKAKSFVAGIKTSFGKFNPFKR